MAVAGVKQGISRWETGITARERAGAVWKMIERGDEAGRSA
jgi:hypothetical protein